MMTHIICIIVATTVTTPTPNNKVNIVSVSQRQLVSVMIYSKLSCIEVITLKALLILW